MAEENNVHEKLFAKIDEILKTISEMKKHLEEFGITTDDLKSQTRILNNLADDFQHTKNMILMRSTQDLLAVAGILTDWKLEDKKYRDDIRLAHTKINKMAKYISEKYGIDVFAEDEK